jgi:hypothetical protein
MSTAAAVPETYTRFDYDKPKIRDGFWIPPYVAMILACLIVGAQQMAGDYGSLGFIGQIVKLIPASLLVPPIVVLVVMLIWIKVIEKAPKVAMIGSFGAMMTICAAYGIIGIKNGSGAMTAIGFIVAALIGLYVAWNRKRIPFAASVLGMAADALTDYTGIIWVAVSFVPLMYFWFIIMVFNLIPFYNALDITGTIFVWSFCFYYGVEVLKTILHTTACGTAGTWYYFAEPKAPTWNAMKRTMTTSFGSVCLGSLVVSILEALLTLTKATVGRCLICLVWCFEWMVRKFNSYSYVQVAIYGKSFFRGAVDTLELLFSKGLTVVINDGFFSIVISASKYTGAILCSAIGYGVAQREFLSKFASGDADAGLASAANYYAYAIAIVQFYIGFGVSALIMNILYSFIITFLVCYCEDPVALNSSRPAYYQKLRDALKEAYGIDQNSAAAASPKGTADTSAPPAYTGNNGGLV